MRLIDANAFLKSEIERCGCVPLIGSCTSDNEIFKFILERQPTIDAKPVVHGEWILEERAGIDYWCCSECHKIKSEYYAKPKDNFCGNCGCDMRAGYEKGMHDAMMMKENADRCKGCAFEDVESWEPPCGICKRNSKDYWREKKV